MSQDDAISETRVLALHLTTPTSSEAKVLAGLIRNADPDVRVDLLLNRRGEGEPGSHFRDLDERPGTTAHYVDVGLPLDPAQHGSLARRLLARTSHVPLRPTIARLAESLQPDLVYTSQQRFDCRLGELIAERLRRPQVVHLHYTPGPWLRDHTMVRLRTCDHVVVVSAFIRDLARANGVHGERLTVIPNTLVPPAESCIEKQASGTINIGQIGRIDPGKGFGDTLHAFESTFRSRPEVRLVLVGDGSERRSIDAAVAKARLGDVVDVTGWQSNVAPTLASLDVFMHPSRQEPFGLAVLEAMAWGVPVIAYRDGATEELVLHERTGLLVDPGDVDGLARALTRLVDDADERRELGRAGRLRVIEHFNPANAGRTFSRLLRSVGRTNRRTD